jgi:hypothetical protein
MSIADQLPDAPKKAVFDPVKALNESLIDVNIPVSKPPACLVIRQHQRDITLCSLGDISVVGGKAKSRKTVLSSIFTAAGVKNGDICDIVWGQLPEDKQGILCFDTEQSDWHAQKAVKRSLQMAGVDEPALFRAYKLRKRNVEERLLMVEAAIKTMPHLGFVIIDGVRDLVYDVNDSKECNNLITKLMAWSDEYFCHIMCVLHENPGSDKLRGHLGTELTAKAETVFKVEKVSDDENASIVTAAYTRNMPFEPIAIGFEDEQPAIFHDYEIKPTTKRGAGAKAPKPKLSDFTVSEHADKLKAIFSISDKMKWRDIQAEILVQYHNIGKEEVRRSGLSYLTSEGYIQGNEEEKNSPSRLYWLGDKIKKLKAPF